MLVQRQIVSATVHAGLNQEQVSGTGTSYAPAASRNREICNAWVEVGQPIKALRPGTRQVVSKPQVRRRSEEHTSELQSHSDLVCRLLLEKKKNKSKET